LPERYPAQASIAPGDDLDGIGQPVEDDPPFGNLRFAKASAKGDGTSMITVPPFSRSSRFRMATGRTMRPVSITLTSTLLNVTPKAFRQNLLDSSSSRECR
jgi:hypothetical protein